MADKKVKENEVTLKDEGTKVESKDVLPESLSTEIKGESNGPEFKANSSKAGVTEKYKTLKVIRN